MVKSIKPTGQLKFVSVFLFFVSTNAPSQVYSSYMTEGIVKAAGGPILGNTQLFLYGDSSFTIIIKAFDYQSKLRNWVLVDSSASRGKWTLGGKILRLDFHPDTVSLNKKFDTYIIKKKGLRRTTLKGVTRKTKYKAGGQLLQFERKK